MSASALIAIVRKGQVKDVMAAAREAGAPGGTVCLARGTASSTILAALGLGDTRQEVLTSLIKKDKADAVLNAVHQAKAKGIAIVIESDMEDSMDCRWVLVEVICEEGYSEEIMAAARKAGAGGGTVINAHGTSTEDDVKFFGSPLVPEKEILMMVIRRDRAESVMAAIDSLEALKKKGMGIVFSIPVRHFVNLGKE